MSARSWAELIDTLHGGLAVVDTSGRITHATERFLEVSGLTADAVLGANLGDIFVHLDSEDRVLSPDDITVGNPVRLKRRFAPSSAETNRSRITGVASPVTERGHDAIVFAQDMAATNDALVSRRRAAVRLTRVDEEEHTRVSRELHDEPIQLLTSLGLRLSLLDDDPAIESLRVSVDDVSSELRSALTEFAPNTFRRSSGSLISQWITPFLETASFDVQIDDRITTTPTHSLAQVCYVFLDELLRALHFLQRTGMVDVLLTDDRGGYRMVITVAAADGTGITNGPVATLYAAMQTYALFLGGSLVTDFSDGTRTLSVWLPDLDESDSGLAGNIGQRAETSERAHRWAFESVTGVPAELSAERWEATMMDLPELIVELDSDLRLTFVNTAYAEMDGTTAAELIDGRAATSTFTQAEYDLLWPYVQHVRTGASVRFGWQRRNAAGEERFVQVAATPRMGVDGALRGVLTAIEDLSDLQVLEHLHESALADLAQARQHARDASVQRLERPLVAMEHLVARLEASESWTTPDDIMRSLTTSLAASIPKIRRSLDLLAMPDVSDGDLGRAIRESLEPHLGGVGVSFVNRAEVAPSTEQSEVLFRIAREAVINAVRHGRANDVSMSLSDGPHRLDLEISDDGVGVAFEDIEPRSDHLGVRSMVERARALAGDCQIERAPGGGTRVRVWLPVAARS